MSEDRWQSDSALVEEEVDVMRGADSQDRRDSGWTGGGRSGGGGGGGSL